MSNMIITGFLSGRGGASKSSTSQATHSKLHNQPEKYKPLLIDYDQQGNTSSTYGLDVNACPTMYHVVSGDISIKDAIQHTKNGDIICGNASLNKIEGEDLTKLRDELLKLHDYTHILIDTAPKIQGTLALQVLISATNIVIPISPDIYSIQGLTRISQVISPVKASYNYNLHIDGVLLTKYDKRLILNKDLLKAVGQWAEQNDTKVYRAKIRESVVVREAQARRQSLWDYAPFSKPAHDYQVFIKEYLESNHV
jgi:chromosome partitioning protein